VSATHVPPRSAAWRKAALCLGLACCGPGTLSSATSAAVSSAGASAQASHVDVDVDVDGDGDGNGDSAPPFEGLPTTSLKPERAPAGCLNQQSTPNHVLALQLAAPDHTLTLSTRAGQLLVNGVACTGLTDPTAIEIIGTNAADTIVIDLSSGALPQHLQGGRLHVDAGNGLDTVALATTPNADTLKLGQQNNQVALDIGPQLPRLRIENHDRLIISTGPGNDRIDAGGHPDVGGAVLSALIVYGGAGSDVIQGGKGADQLHGGDGDDFFTTAASSDGADLYDGGGGIDGMSYDARSAPLTVKLDNRNDDGEAGEHDDVRDTIEVLLGGRGDDTLTGGAHDDSLVGGPGDDRLYGGAGDDTFFEASSMQGHDIMNGGTGIDSVDYSERATALHVTLCVSSSEACTGACQCAADDGEAGEADTLVNVENVSGGRGNDLLHGSAADNALFGNEGDDVLRGEGGHDEIYGGDGHDELYGGDGDDLLNGDEGVDVIDGGDGDGDDDLCIWELTEHAQSCER